MALNGKPWEHIVLRLVLFTLVLIVLGFILMTANVMTSFR